MDIKFGDQFQIYTGACVNRDQNYARFRQGLCKIYSVKKPLLNGPSIPLFNISIFGVKFDPGIGYEITHNFAEVIFATSTISGLAICVESDNAS